MNTVSTTITSIEYSPLPTPPGDSSPSIMLSKAMPPARGCSDSCRALIAPVEVLVVAEAKTADQTAPSRCSLPSMLPPATSAHVRRPIAPTPSAAMTPASARPWRRSPTMSP